MNYLDVLNDQEIINRFKEIDNHNDNQFNHGLQHVNNVIENLLKLAKLLRIKEPELNYLLIACVLHDLGQLEGSEDHYLRSKKIAANYLKDMVNQEWFDKIIPTIENHHDKNNIDNLSLFEHLVLFADKMDFTYKRLDVNYIKEYQADYLESHIIDTNYKMEDGIFKVIITIDGDVNQDDLDRWPYYPKIEKRIEEFATKLKLNYLIEFEVQEKRLVNSL